MGFGEGHTQTAPRDLPPERVGGSRDEISREPLRTHPGKGLRVERPARSGTSAEFAQTRVSSGQQGPSEHTPGLLGGSWAFPL